VLPYPNRSSGHSKKQGVFMKPAVLIADSDADLCDVYQKFVSARGYEVETASDGLDCLAKLRQATPAAVVLDLKLRWGGGDGVLAWLREERAASGVAVILTATPVQALDFREVHEPPVIGCLLKPFALTALLERVRSAVAGGQMAARKPAFSELFWDETVGTGHATTKPQAR
jgi:DNA-binding response OmpR family regulator